MEKIIQIATDVDCLYCLTSDGKVYERAIKDKQEHLEPKKEGQYGQKAWVTGTRYWREIPIEEKF